MCVVGLPGVGKSTGFLAAVQLMLFGYVHPGDNDALKRLLEQQFDALDYITATPDIKGTLIAEPLCDNVYIHCDASKLTERRFLKAAGKVPVILLEVEDEDGRIPGLEMVIAATFFDECDNIALVKPNKKMGVVGLLQKIAEGNVAAHHIKMFVWVANITPLAQHGDYLLQRESVHGQLKAMLSDKFTAERMPSALNTIILTCVVNNAMFLFNFSF